MEKHQPKPVSETAKAICKNKTKYASAKIAAEDVERIQKSPYDLLCQAELIIVPYAIFGTLQVI